MVRVPVSDRASGAVKATKHPGNGYYFVSGALTRPGIFRYETTDGDWINAVRLPSEVFSDTYLATVQGSAIMLDHPDKILVEPGDPTDGLIVSAAVDKGAVQITAWVQSLEAIAAIDSGVRQLSACFTPDWVEMTDAEIADARMQFPDDAKACRDGIWRAHRNMINNHGAIVGVGRVSGSVLDSASIISEVKMSKVDIPVIASDAIAEAPPIMGGEVATLVPEIDGPSSVEETPAVEEKDENAAAALIMAAAQGIAALASSMVSGCSKHGIEMGLSDVIADSAAAADKVISHFGVNVPAVMDSPNSRVEIANMLLSQKPLEVVSDSTVVELDDEVVDSVDNVIVADSIADPIKAANNLHDTLKSMWASANKAV